MNKQTTNVKYIILVFFIIFLVVFYWLAIRPSNIKKECHVTAVQKAQEWYRQTTRDADEETTYYNNSVYEKRYKECLNQKGL